MLKKILLSVFIFLVLGFISVVRYHNYNQDQNIKQLLAQNLDGRLIPHKLNYLNKLNNALNHGLRSFEIDALFNIEAKVPFFEIGHDKKELNGRSFEEYLKRIEGRGIKKIWLDLKNLNADNILEILKRLDFLNSIYGFKNILILETGASLELIKLISEAGYHTSYYLPNRGFKALFRGDIRGAQQEARRIAKQIKLQKLKGISFPREMYAFVKTHLEPIIPSKISYHLWGTYKFKKKDEFTKIKTQKFYEDKRVKTIIYSYFNKNFNNLYMH